MFVPGLRRVLWIRGDIMKGLFTLAVMGMILMPIGGVRESGSVAEAGPMVTAAPLASPWLVSPVRLVVVCAVLLSASWLNRYHRRQLHMEGRRA